MAELLSRYLEDFMNTTSTGVTNAANLSLFMVNMAYRLRADIHARDSDYSVLDLKADCRGYKYVEETIQMLPEKPEPVLFAKILAHVACLGRIRPRSWDRPLYAFRGGLSGAGASSTDSNIAANIERGGSIRSF